jgi:hypothetical protein
VKSYQTIAANRRKNPQPTPAELEARRLRDLQRLNDAWRVLTREVRT